MRLFAGLYEKALYYARHPKAERYLAGLSFAESSFFPIPPDVMLAPMCLARVSRAWRYAFLTTVFSVLGGVFGYLIGMFAFELIQPALQQTHYWTYYLQARDWFDHYGVWVVFIAGFSPVPYKIITITAGVTGMAFLPFVLASIIGRGLRFYLVAGLIRWGGERMEAALHRYVEPLGWLLVVLAVVAYLLA